MSADVRLSLGAQAVLVQRVRDLRLVQYALTDRAAQMTGANTAFLAGESDAIREALNEIEAVLRVAMETEQGS